MNNAQMLQKLYTMKDYENENSFAYKRYISEELDVLIEELKLEIAKEKVGKPTEKKALALMKRLQKKMAKGQRPILQYMKLIEDKMYFTDSYFAIALNKDDTWLDTMKFHDENSEGSYPDIKRIFDTTKTYNEFVQFAVTRAEVDYWKKTVKKEGYNGCQLVDFDMLGSDGNTYKATINVKYLDYLLTLLQEDELVFRARIKTAVDKCIIAPFEAYSEKGCGICLPCRHYE